MIIMMLLPGQSGLLPGTKTIEDKYMPIELYIHIPFCIRKCNYCDFLSFPVREEVALFCYMDALYQEIRETAASLGMLTSVSSVFIGGGTPSLLPCGSVRKLLDLIADSFVLEKGAEITIEANPGTLDRARLEEYRKAGINRLSIGLQSPDDKLLARLGRVHRWEDFLNNYRLARETGFDNINIDVMSGLPGQSPEAYEAGLYKILDLKPEHISSYSLILEEGTPFYKDQMIRAALPDEETDRLMYRRTREILKDYGYSRYEISNYALPGKECRHNLGYWSGVPYLGLGLGASSFWKGDTDIFPSRFSNSRDLDAYIHQPFIPFQERSSFEKLTEKDCMEEYMFLGLRRMKGVSVKYFDRVFSASMEEVYGRVLRKYERMGLLLREGDRIRLSEEGIDVSDYIFTDFML